MKIYALYADDQVKVLPEAFLALAAAVMPRIIFYNQSYISTPLIFTVFMYLNIIRQEDCKYLV
jgi:hypothetical protein